MLTYGNGDGWEWAEFHVGPQLIHRRATLEIDFISNGEPTVRIANKTLIDVDVVRVQPRTFSIDTWELMVVAAPWPIDVLARLIPRARG